MSLFDTYQPVPSLQCEKCHQEFVGWQGKGAGCGLFVWRQGNESPIGQNADDANLLAQDLSEQRLPETFEMYTYGCDTCGRIEAVGNTVNGIWSETVLITAVNAEQKKHETRADFKERLRRLSYRAT